MKDHIDEINFAKSDGPYHINESLIRTDHDIDLSLVEKIKSNPKVLNTKAP